MEETLMLIAKVYAPDKVKRMLDVLLKEAEELRERQKAHRALHRRLREEIANERERI